MFDAQNREQTATAAAGVKPWGLAPRLSASGVARGPSAVRAVPVRQTGAVPWIYLAVSVIGASFTLAALRPFHRWQLRVSAFFGAWITGELALWHLAWQAAATLVFAALGAFDSWPGWLGLAITLASWAGLVVIVVTSRGAGEVVATALDDARIPGGPPLRGAASPRDLALPFWLRDGAVERLKDLEYAPGAGRRHRLDLYRRRGGTAGAPVLVQIHGGAWVIGDKGQQGLPLMLHLAARGWVCVAINYRRSPQVQMPEHLVDCKRALHWVRTHAAEYGGDPSFVAVTGGSAGGHLAAMTALTANDPRLQPGFEDADTGVDACVPMYGVYDLAPLFAQDEGSFFGDWMARRIVGRSLREGRDRFDDASPINHVAPGAPRSSSSTGAATTSSPSSRPGGSSLRCARFRESWSPTSRSRARPTPSTCSTRSGRAGPSPGWSGSWSGRGPGTATSARRRPPVARSSRRTAPTERTATGTVRVDQRPVRRPRAVRRDDQSRQSDQHAVVVDPPTGEVAPGLLAVGAQRHAGLLELPAHVVPLRAVDRDGVRRQRVGVVPDAVEVGDRPERVEPGPHAERGLVGARHVERGHVQRGGVEDRPRGRDPGALRLR